MPSIKSPRAHAALLLSGIIFLYSGNPRAWAQEASDQGQAPPSTIVDGFRSAKFGMSIADVRQAISIDFHIGDGQIRQAENPVDRTTVLEAIVPDVLPNGGKSLVDYIFGYHSRALISATITWSGKLDPTVTPTVLQTNGATLQSYFRNAGYKADTIKMNALLNIGYLLFQGSDVEGHMTRLLLAGNLKQDQAGHVQLQSTALNLQYIADPANPDIFRIAPGQF